MTDLWVLAFVITPLLVVALGWGAVLWHEHDLRKRRDHPAE